MPIIARNATFKNVEHIVVTDNNNSTIDLTGSTIITTDKNLSTQSLMRGNDGNIILKDVKIKVVDKQN